MMQGNYTRNTNKQQGAVSLFIVIFSALLITTLTISFMQLMIKDQQQAMYSDLSESAYDSAVAGVEDAKRALLRQQECIDDFSTNCNNVRDAIAAGQCTTLSAIFGGSPSGEVAIMQSAGDRKLEQAYTCVKIANNTHDYIGSIESDASATLIPLRGESAFNRVIISWNQSKNGGEVDLPTDGNIDLPIVGPLGDGTPAWPENRPALLRAQLINGGGHGAFRLSDFDTSSYSNTLFLHPSGVGVSELSFDADGRRGASGNEPKPIRCDETVASGAYACRVELHTSAPISGGNETVFLSLAAFYNATDYKIELRNSESPDPNDRVVFSGVQPEVDSTGRANDLFRRVKSRIELNNTFNYPIAALESRNNICKNFSVTNIPADYKTVECDPLKNI